MRHFLVNKPQGFLSQFHSNQKEQKKSKFLGELFDFPEGTMAIGRLDKNSEGLLLLTTEGRESERVRSKAIEKEYYVQLDGLIDQEAINILCYGVEIGIRDRKYKTKPCIAKTLDPPPNFPPPIKPIRSERHGPTSWISIILKEGKFRQIRKMTAAVGFPTLRLIRIRVGNITLEKIEVGEVIEVNQLKI